MISALFSFLGGSVFRMIWGEVSAWLTAKQEHKHEIERLRLQGELDAAQHERNQAAIKLQADLGVQTIRVQSDADIGKIDAEGWYRAVQDGMKPTGIFVVDLWNGIIRPMAATIAIYLWVLALHAHSWSMGDWDKELVGAILGFFLADRALVKRNK